MTAICPGCPSGTDRRELSREGKFSDPSAVKLHLLSRPLLESHVRQRVSAIDNVEILDGHDFVERRVARQQIGRASFDHPSQMGLGKRVAQRAQHRQGVEHVANGAETHDQNSRGRCRHARNHSAEQAAAPRAV